MEQRTFPFTTEIGTTKITLSRRVPFINQCPVFGYNDFLDAEIEYIPSDKVLENSVFRNYFDKAFEERLELIAYDAFRYFYELVRPKYMKLTMRLLPVSNSHDVKIEIES